MPSVMVSKIIDLLEKMKLRFCWRDEIGREIGRVLCVKLMCPAVQWVKE